MRTRIALGVALMVACVTHARVGRAQTWEGGRTTPDLGETLLVDETGEPEWLYGSEDLADDGAVFLDTEAAIDVRTVYGTNGGGSFWLRVYVASRSAPPAELTAYLFVDSDHTPSTGGPATAVEIDPALTDDPSSGGYEFLVTVPADDSAPAGVWQWDGDAWVELNLQPNRIRSEVGVDTDPVLFRVARRGYVQVEITHGEAGIAAACETDFLLRTTNGEAEPGLGDLAIGETFRCVPEDSDDDGLPDVVEPADCTTLGCPGDLVCVNRHCVVPAECTTPDQCPDGLTCVDRVCIVDTSCTTSDSCPGDLVCVDEICVNPPACTSTDPCPGDLVCDDGVCLAPVGCARDDQCAGDLVCDDGACVVPTSCTTSTSCPGDQECIEGVCRTPGDVGGCTRDDQCSGDLICDEGDCVVPTSCTTSAGCPGDQECVEGVCRSPEDPEYGLELDEGDEVRGGSCKCQAPGGKTQGAVWLALAAGLVAMLRRRSRRS